MDAATRDTIDGAIAYGQCRGWWEEPDTETEQLLLDCYERHQEYVDRFPPRPQTPFGEDRSTVLAQWFENDWQEAWWAEQPRLSCQCPRVYVVVQEAWAKYPTFFPEEGGAAVRTCPCGQDLRSARTDGQLTLGGLA